MLVNLHIDLGRAHVSTADGIASLLHAQEGEWLLVVVVERRMGVVGSFAGVFAGELAALVYVCYRESDRAAGKRPRR